MTIDRYHPFVLAAALAAALFPSPAGASHAEGGVTLFAAGDYRGASDTFHGDVPSLNGTPVGNDHASSVRLAPGCSATLYEHHEYRGRSTVVDYDIPDLRRTAVGNDTVSSLRVHCDSYPGSGRGRQDGGVALYTAGGYEGQSEFFYRDDANLSNNRIGNDRASSVRVSPGCRAILYAGGDFRGRSVEVTYDVRNLGATSVGNDTVSSLRVECDRRRDRWGDRDDRWDDRSGDRRDGSGTWGSPWGRGHDDRGHDDRGDYGRGGVTLYQRGDFGGTHETFFGDVPDLSRTAVGNDHVSSVRVSRGCRAVLYRHSHYRGETTVLTYDEPDLRYSEVGNDEVSSIKVDCRR